MEFVSSILNVNNTKEETSEISGFNTTLSQGLVVYPFDINQGYVIANTSIPCRLYNPNTDSEIILNSISTKGFGKIESDIVFPLTIKAGETIEFNLIFKKSDEFFFGEIIYNYDNKSEKIQKVSIYSMYNINTNIDYGSTILENLQFLTSINKSYNGKEHRIQLIDNPRLSINGTFILMGDERRKLENTLNKGMGKQISAPLYSLNTELLEDSDGVFSIESISGREIYVEQKYSILQRGMRILIQQGPKKEEAEIYSIDGNRVVLFFNLKNYFDKEASVIPFVNGYLSDQVVLDRLTNDIVSLSFTLTAKDNLYRHLLNFNENGLPKYNDLPVFNVIPDRRSHNNNLISDMITVSKGFGPRTIIEKELEVENIHSVRYINFTREENYKMKSLLKYAKGRLNYFWFPTLNRDFEPMENITSLTNTIRVNRSVYFSNYEPNNEHIRIKKNDGTEYYRKITNYIINETEEFIVIDEPLGVDLDLNDIMIIDFLKKVRFDTDRFTMKIISNEVSEINLTMRETI